MSKAPDGRTVLGRLTLEEANVAQRIGTLVSGEVTWVDGAAARALARMGLHELALIIEAHEGAIGAGAQVLADKARGE